MEDMAMLKQVCKGNNHMKKTQSTTLHVTSKASIDCQDQGNWIREIFDPFNFQVMFFALYPWDWLIFLTFTTTKIQFN